MRTVRRTHGRIARLARAGVVLLAGATFVGGCDFQVYDLPLPGGVATGENAYTVTAAFRDVLNLVPKSAVKVDDVTVGSVDDVWREGWHAKVRLRLKPTVELPDNAVASIRQTSLLGEKYVELAPPAAAEPVGRLSEGDVIPLSRTGRTAELEEVLGALSLVLNGGGIAQLRTISRELNQVMDGRENRLRHLLGELNELVASLDEQKSQIVRAIEQINELSATLRAERETIGTAIEEIAPALKVLADQREQLTRMLEALADLGKVGSRVIEQSADDVLAILADLEPILTKLVEAGDALPKAIDLLVTYPFPESGFETVHGDYTNVAVTVDLSLETLINDLVRSQPSKPDISPPDESDRLQIPGDLADPTDLGRLCRGLAGTLPAALGGVLRGSCPDDPGALKVRQREKRIDRICAAARPDPDTDAGRVCREHRVGSEDAGGGSRSRDEGSGSDLVDLLVGGLP